MHELALEYSAHPEARRLLEDVVTAEVMLEVYLRERGLSKDITGDILETRDQLFRGLARSRLFSPKALALELRESGDNDIELERALVTAARTLGFVAKHVGGAGQPDGMARYGAYRNEEALITLEAKASSGQPSLSQLDLAGVAEHARAVGADGCLMVAPRYPGQNRDPDGSALASRAEDDRISCWTVEQLARAVEATETRHIGPQDILKIVTQSFSPASVTIAVDRLLAEPSWQRRDLYNAIADAIQYLSRTIRDRPLDASSVQTYLINQHSGFDAVERDEIIDACREMGAASGGGLRMDDRGDLILLTSAEELSRRLVNFVQRHPAPRRPGEFYYGPQPDLDVAPNANS